jgi:hypothetical protein
MTVDQHLELKLLDVWRSSRAGATEGKAEEHDRRTKLPPACAFVL